VEVGTEAYVDAVVVRIRASGARVKAAKLESGAEGFPAQR
jgi:hypothetical protein